MTKVAKVFKKLYKKESSKIGHHIGIPDQLYNHENFRTLSPAAKVLMLEFTHRWTIHNNGQIVGGIKSMAKACNMCPKSTHRALKMLESRGFIIKTKPGQFTTNEASEYLLTYRGKSTQAGNIELLNLWKYWTEDKNFMDEDERNEALANIRKGILNDYNG